ncbi:hypothetical protein FQN52_002136 [Onygenales sp. PD_12]|nr:hypothetical protein FQN52_002136 [Onygenales sp. PD_12]KAK2790576.1 hypothetical protein FQN53_009044 [Emmonsiellopsis sp. PD_33]KAK2797645.1 hypothetical protein FQN51_008339 [Onygenales sp. PD_10]
MCNGFSSRGSQGGAMAFLRPLSTHGTNSVSNCHVTLRECHAPGIEGIELSFNRPRREETKTEHPCPIDAFRTCWIEIHPDGDLTPSKHRDSHPALYRFPLQNLAPTPAPTPEPQQDQEEESSLPTTLASMSIISEDHDNTTTTRLRLDTHETGVIGRRMSIVDAMGMRVAEGVIGWN